MGGSLAPAHSSVSSCQLGRPVKTAATITNVCAASATSLGARAPMPPQRRRGLYCSVTHADILKNRTITTHPWDLVVLAVTLERTIFRRRYLWSTDLKKDEDSIVTRNMYVWPISKE